MYTGLKFFVYKEVCLCVQGTRRTTQCTAQRRGYLLEAPSHSSMPFSWRYNFCSSSKAICIYVNTMYTHIHHGRDAPTCTLEVVAVVSYVECMCFILFPDKEGFAETTISNIDAT